jgi:hypothetical protein
MVENSPQVSYHCVGSAGARERRRQIGNVRWLGLGSRPVGDEAYDEFSGFAGSEHMFFGLAEPFQFIRRQVESSFREQVSDSIVRSIRMQGAPKFLTIARKTDDDETTAIVAHFAFCLRATVIVHSATSNLREEVKATLTFMFGHMDKPGIKTSRAHIDLHEEADAAYDDALFKKRFLSFRASLE